MTYKMIIIGDHAGSRLRQRGFTKGDVRWLLAKGIREPGRTRGGEFRWTKRGIIGTREARVVYIEDAHRIELVTVEWVGDPPEGGKA